MTLCHSLWQSYTRTNRDGTIPDGSILPFLFFHAKETL